MSLSAEMARTQLDSWPKMQVECGATKTVIMQFDSGPWPPRFSGPLGHPPRASPSLVQVWRHFATFFLARWGVPAPKGQNKGFARSGRIRRGMGPERCGSGAPIDPSSDPIAGLVERDTFFLTPLLGYGGCSKTP